MVNLAAAAKCLGTVLGAEDLALKEGLLHNIRFALCSEVLRTEQNAMPFYGPQQQYLDTLRTLAVVAFYGDEDALAGFKRDKVCHACFGRHLTQDCPDIRTAMA